MRYLFFILIELIYLFKFLTGDLAVIVEMVLLAFVLYFIQKVEKLNTTDAKLTSQEKRVVLATEFLSPVIAGAFYYYCWKGKLPIKAKSANRYSWIMVGLQIGIGIVLYKFGLIS